MSTTKNNKQVDFDIIIIGAGAAGIGMGALLEKCGLTNYQILERGEIGYSFENWPSYTRFISPSFTGNYFNAVDLNALTPDTSPAFTLNTEHPSGPEYAHYLKQLASYFKLNILTKVVVQAVAKKDELFSVQTNKGDYTCKFLIWAGGEVSNPSLGEIIGSELCVHSSQAKSFLDNTYTIIGGYESGMELAAHLLEQGKKVTVIDATEPWNLVTSDSSISLAPATKDRLRPFVGGKNLQLLGNKKVTEISFQDKQYRITFEDGKYIVSLTQPILATGFHSLSPVIKDFFNVEANTVNLTANDESTAEENLFLVGPRVKHGGALFCFIYKFRQRLPIVAETIAERLGVDISSGIDPYKKANIYLKDLSCCENECAC